MSDFGKDYLTEEYPHSVDDRAAAVEQRPTFFDFDDPYGDDPMIYLKEGWHGLGSLTELAFVSGGSIVGSGTSLQFTSNVEITGSLSIGGDEVTASANEINEAADWSARTKLLSEENYTILDDDGYAVFLVVTGAGSTGTATTDTENKLIDSTATFETDGVVAGDYIHNTTDDTWGIVDSVDSETELTLTTDAFPDGNEDWEWAPVAVVVPTAADNTGRKIFMKKLDSDDGIVHIAFESGEDETGVATLEGEGGYIEIVSNGSDWYIKDYYDHGHPYTNQWWEKRGDGTLKQWGYKDIEQDGATRGSEAVTFDKTFDEAPMVVTSCARYYEHTSIGGGDTAPTTTGFTLYIQNIFYDAQTQTTRCEWHAIGRWK